jgi:choline dehydrogenase-like flavoprotein
MIIDALTLENNTILEESIVIVGAGAAGITLACEFEDMGKNAILLESGGFSFDSEVQSLYKGFVDDSSSGALPHEPLDIYRARFFGGTTNWWGGACLPYDKVDFLHKPSISNSGWPITREVLKKYYIKANDYLGIESVNYDLPPKSRLGSREVIDGLEKTGVFKTKYWIEKERQVNFGKKYKDRLKSSKHIKVILNANVVSLTLKQNSISELQVKTLNDKNIIVKGKEVILSMGGLEIPRILLASISDNHKAIGNAFDLVGRYYSPHANLTHGILILNPDVELDKDTEELSDAILYRKFVSLTDRYVSKGYMNCKVTLESLDSVEKNDLTEHVYKLFHSSVNFDEIYENIMGRKKFAFALNGAFDQVPNFESRVKLSNERDILGVPKIILKHAITKQDIQAYSNFYELLALTLGSSGIGRFCYDKSLQQLYQQGGGASHHTGTTRMANSPENGVVDKNCNVFGVSNLYIASSSVFPTASHANPTYTIVALAIRLANHIKNKKEISA